MTIRVYLHHTFIPTGKHPDCHYKELSNGARVNLHCEGGTYYFAHPSFHDPIHPELRPHVERVTYKEVFTNVEVMGRVRSGSYVHGRFFADAINQGGNGATVRSLVVTARAPSLSQLARWLRPLLAGQDTPRGVNKNPPAPLATPNVVVSPTAH